MDSMKKVVVEATHRSVTGKKVGALRREGKLPGVMYGHNFETTPIIMDLKAATQTLSGLSASHVITIVLDGKEHAALVREKQRDYIRNVYTHLDFQVVSLTEKIRTHVPIVLEGLSPAVKDYNGVVVSGLSQIEVEALPGDLPDRIAVDLAALKNIGDAVYVRDLSVPAKVVVLTHGEEMIANVTGQAAEEVEEELAGPAEPEVIEKGKKEEEEEE